MQKAGWRIDAPHPLWRTKALLSRLIRDLRDLQPPLVRISHNGFGRRGLQPRPSAKPPKKVSPPGEKAGLGRATEAVEDLKEDQAQRNVNQDGADGGDGLKRRRRLKQRVLKGGQA